MPAVPSLQDIEFDPAVRQPTDQILFRFIKLQDALGERLVPGTLDAQAESFEAGPMRDRFDRREKLGCLDVAAGLRN